MLLTIAINSFLLMIVIGMALIFCSFTSRKHVSMVDIGMGTVSLIVFSTIVSWLNVDRSLLWIVVVTALIVAAIIILIRLKPSLLSLELKMFGFFYSTFSFVFALANGFKYRAMVNPDPIGHAALVGGLHKYGSYSNILERWQKETGQPFNFEFDWNAPTKLLESPWNVPNDLIKYSADAIYFQRTGVSSFLSFFFSKGTPFEAFPIAWNSIGILAISLCASLLVKINLNMLHLSLGVDKIESPKGKIRRPLPRPEPYIGLIIFILFACSIGLVVFVLEGFVPHLVSFMLILLTLVILSETQREHLKSNVVIMLLILVIGMYCVYLQMLPFLLAVILFYFAIQFRGSAGKLTLKVISFASLLLVSISLILYNLPGVKYLVSTVTGVSGHGAVHLGIPTLRDFIGLNPARLSIETPAPGKFATIFSTDTFNISTQHWGYGPISGSTIAVNLWAIFFLWLAFISYKLFSPSVLSKLVLSSSIIAIAYTVYYYVMSTHLATEGRVFSDYVWLRINLLSTMLIYCWLPALIYFGIIKFFKRTKNLVIFFIPILIMSLGLKNSVGTLLDFSKVSQSFNVSKDCPDFGIASSIGRVLITSDNSSHHYAPMNLFLCDYDIVNLNDPYPSRHNLVSGDEVFAFTYDNNLGIWGYARVGRVKEPIEIQSPCSFECVLSQDSIEMVRDASVLLLEN